MKKITLFYLFFVSVIVHAQTMVIDATFNAGGIGVNGPIYSSVVQPDGKILIGGGFTSYNDVARSNIARLNADGTLDTTFDPGAGASAEDLYSGIFGIALATDGKIYIAGTFDHFNGISRTYLARLNSNGSLDSFIVPFSFDTSRPGGIHNIDTDSNGSVLLSGGFTCINGVGNVLAKNLFKINSDATFNYDIASHYFYTGVSCAKFSSEGNVFIGMYPSIYKKNSDLSDASFVAESGVYGAVYDMLLQNDGKIIAGGNFSENNGLLGTKLARLNSDGSLDATFQRYQPENPYTSQSVRKVVSYLDDKYVICGDFTNYGDNINSGIAILNNDGTVDESFDFGLGLYSPETVNSYNLTILPDNRILVSGNFLRYNDVHSPFMVVLSSANLGSTGNSSLMKLITYRDKAGRVYSSKNEIIKTIVVIDSSGREVYSSGDINDTKFTSPIILNNGIFVSRITLGDGSVVTIKHID